ncbi:PIR protein, putative [Plasmodium sp.]|nr:PIR protein, putative [Plasmodium sp.]
MKVHYINILMFALPLNIFVTLCHVSSKKNPYITHNTPSTKAIITPRTLCECYATSNYDNDPEMKEVMENYNRQASQRFKEYDERMNKNRQKYKEQCDKEIQKIILKEKIEKELTEKFATLDTNIATNDIPTCVCEKSLADKAENFCLKCGYELGGGVLQASSLLGGIGQLGIDAWKAAALITAKDLSAKAGVAAGEAARIKAGIKAIMDGLCTDFRLSTPGVKELGLVFNAKNYNNSQYIFEAIFTKYQGSCMVSEAANVPLTGTSEPICSSVLSKVLEQGLYTQDMVSREAVIKSTVKTMVSQAEIVADVAADTATNKATSLAIKTNSAVVDATYSSSQIAIIASIVAILVIVLVMVIIYLILRYQRKKKMKKKLQYIKLLKE